MPNVVFSPYKSNVLDLEGDPDREISGKIFQEIGDRFDRDLERPSKRRSR